MCNISYYAIVSSKLNDLFSKKLNFVVNYLIVVRNCRIIFCKLFQRLIQLNRNLKWKYLHLEINCIT